MSRIWNGQRVPTDWTKILVWGVVMLVNACLTAAVADDIRIAPIGSWPGYARGPARALATTETHAYLAAAEGGLIIVDIRDPANPRRIGGYDTSDNVQGVTVVGTFAYVADGSSGLQVIDVSDPANSRRIGGYDTRDYAYGVAVVGTFAYVADASSGLQVIDVTDPANPQRVGGLDTDGSAKGVVVVGTLAYVADGGSGLQVIDVSDPANPRRIGGYDTSESAMGVAVVGTFAYVADGSSGLQVIDVSDPANPRLIARHLTGGVALGVVVVGTLAYLADGDAGLEVIDVSDPANPRQVGRYDTSGAAYDVAVVGTLAYVADGGSGLEVIDVSDPANPRQVGRYDTSDFADNVAVVGNLAYVADDDAGLQVIDVSDPANPRQVGRYDTSGVAYDVAVVGTFAYVADGGSGLQVIDVSDPANPRQVGRYDTSDFADSVAVVGTFAYVTGHDAGLQVIDVSDPANPRQVGRYDTSGSAEGVAVVGNLAYVADYDAGLQVIDVSDPANPRLIARRLTGGVALGVVVVGNLAYVADGLSGLQVIDVSDPANPRQVGRYDTSGFARDVAVVGTLAYVADGRSGLQVIDVSDPANPRSVGGYNTSGDARGVAVVRTLAYVADDFQGLQVFRVDGGGPSSPAILGAPTHRSVPVGATTSLAVTASGTEPLAYQWWRDGYRIEGATNPVLALPSVTAADAGEFTVLVSNAEGTVMSAPARLQVLAPPEIQRPPEKTTVISGSGFQLGVRADGGPTLAYQWFKDGNSIAGATSSNLVRTSATLADAGLYSLVVTNLAGSVTSAPVTVRVLEPLRIVSGPASLAVGAGERVEFTVEASGSGPFTYEWRLNGQAIPLERNATARSATLVIEEARLSHAGSYTVVVVNEAQVVVLDPPVELTLAGLNAVNGADAFAGAADLPSARGTMASSNVGATREAGEPTHAGKPGGSSVWFEWTAPSTGTMRIDTVGSAFDTLLAVYTGDRVDALIPVASDEDGGGFFTSALRFNAQAGVRYRIAVDGLAGAAGRLILSWSFEGIAALPPEIVAQPAGETRKDGERDVQLRVVARGATGYQWLRNDAELPGETRTNLLLDPYGVDKVGIYEVRVSGPSGAVTSQAVSMELGTDPRVRATDKLAELLARRGNEPGGGAAALQSQRLTAPGGLASPAWVIQQGVATFGFDNRRATTSPEEPPVGYRINQGTVWFDLRVRERGAMKVRSVGGKFPVILGLHPPEDRKRVLHLGTNSVLKAASIEAGSYLLSVQGEDKGYIGLEVLLGQPPSESQESEYLEKAFGDGLVLAAPRVPSEPKPTYQWLQDGKPLPGQNGSTYRIPAGSSSAHRGLYAVVIDNGLGRVTNVLWKVEVVIPSGMDTSLPPRWENGRIRIGVGGTPGQRMIMQRSQDLLRFAEGEEFWMPSTGTAVYEDATAAERPSGFYRLVEKPLEVVQEGEMKAGGWTVAGWRVEGGRLGQPYSVEVGGVGESKVLKNVVRDQPWHLQAPTGAVVRLERTADTGP